MDVRVTAEQYDIEWTWALWPLEDHVTNNNETEVELTLRPLSNIILLELCDIYVALCVIINWRKNSKLMPLYLKSRHHDIYW